MESTEAAGSPAGVAAKGTVVSLWLRPGEAGWWPKHGGFSEDADVVGFVIHV